MMAGVATVCEECAGKRFQASVLEYKLAGRDISEVLAMSSPRRWSSSPAGRRKPRPH
jgi:excinuclease UvrABC ATPase subunit